MKKLLNLLILAMITILPASVFSEVPLQFSFQGVLKDTSGSPVDDAIYAIKFTIYSDSIAGNPLWETVGFVPIQTTKGLFQHILGSTNPIPDSIGIYSNLWVGIKVNLEPEMLPRTKLTSVPFSLSAKYADTATVSMDKTINAGELTLGVLDTARFSAYQDLLSENRVGLGSNQLAIGSHTHPGVSGEMMRIEDTTTVSIDLFPNSNILVKQLIIPPNTIGNYFRISFPYLHGHLSSGIWMDFIINSIFIASIRPVEGNHEDYVNFSALKLDGNNWIIATGGVALGNYYIYQSFDARQGLNIQMYIRGDIFWQGDPIKIGNLIVEYDID
jgi:hypothetical protein